MSLAAEEVAALPPARRFDDWDETDSALATLEKKLELWRSFHASDPADNAEADLRCRTHLARSLACA
jgi:hypothetical protein